MPVMQQLRSFRAERAVENQLLVNREDISWHNVAPDRVRIEVTVSNVSVERSPRTELRLQAAPLGVFLPWKDLTTLWVPPLDGDKVVTLSTEVSCPRPRPLGRFDRVPPRRLATALGLFDDDGQGQTATGGPLSALRARLGQWFGRLGPRSQPDAVPQLPPDPMDLLGRANEHWAGNINVFVGNEVTERHVADALRIYPGRINKAALLVGNGQRDVYTFGITGDGTAWKAELFAQVIHLKDMLTEFMGRIALGTPRTVDGLFVVVLSIEPPATCERGELAVHVTRGSTGQTAMVEFSLDAAAQGPGCYTA